MPEHFKALIVVMTLASAIFVVGKPPALSAGYDESLYKRHRTIWITITLIVFLSHNFWVFALLSATALAIAAKRDRAPLSLYFFILFAAPHFAKMIPGFGPIENLFEINYVRILNLTVLLPLAITLYDDRNKLGRRFMNADLALMSFIALITFKVAINDSIPGTLRTCFYLVVDIWIPYYVASRYVTTISQFRQVAIALVVATVIVALIAMFESLRHWLLYDSLRNILGTPRALHAYLTRGEGGPLRANVSAGHPIVVGYVIMVGLGMFAFISRSIRMKWIVLTGVACLIGGFAATVSRGPWVGAAALVAIMVVLGPGLGRRLTVTTILSTFLFMFMLLSPMGQRIIDYIPFVGTVESGNIDYRARLFDVSMEVFLQNPMVGDFFFLENPIMEQMRQGQGIIDMVNSYLQIALPYGAIGLFFYVCALVLPVVAAWRARQLVLKTDPEAEILGRALIATMAGIMVTIATVSSIGIIPTLYWIMEGLCLSYSQLVMKSRAGERGARPASKPIRTLPLRTRSATKQ